MAYCGLVGLLLAGAICAIRLPIFQFAILALISVGVYAVFFRGTFGSVTDLFIWYILDVVALQLGYLAGNFLIFMYFAKSRKKEKRSFSALMRSKYFPDSTEQRPPRT